MALAMARPWKHPKTGVYWLRKAVPKELRVLVGKLEEKRTLGTKEPTAAKRLHAAALADLEAQWAALRDHGDAAGPERLRIREAAAMTAHARWCLHAAAARTESRGMHLRTDAPDRDPAQARRLLTGGLDGVWSRFAPLADRDAA